MDNIPEGLRLQMQLAEYDIMEAINAEHEADDLANAYCDDLNLDDYNNE